MGNLEKRLIWQVYRRTSRDWYNIGYRYDSDRSQNTSKDDKFQRTLLHKSKYYKIMHRILWHYKRITNLKHESWENSKLEGDTNTISLRDELLKSYYVTGLMHVGKNRTLEAI